MAVEWLNDDLTLKPGFEANLPAELRDYAKDAKDLPGLIKRGVDTQRDLHSRIKIPDTPEGKREVLTKHFQDVLDADEATRKKASEEADAAAKKKAEEDHAAAVKTTLENAEKELKGVWGTDYDKNLELTRRAVRGEHCPPYLKDAIAKAAGVEVKDLTDAQIQTAVAHDPFVARTLLTIATLAADGRFEHGDGHAKGEGEREPAYPFQPQYYAGRPDTDPEKRFFIARGAKFENGKYIGGYGVAGR